MKKLIAAALAAVALTLTACVDDAPSEGNGTMRAYKVALPGGETVVCVSNYKGVDCDWEGVR